MKRNKFFILGLIAAFVAVLSLTLVSGTWAKYTQTVTGTANAQVAKWSVKVNDATLASDSQFINFDLFKTIKDSDGTSDEQDVKAGKIAPGTQGQFKFVLTNNSDVNVKATVNLTVTNEKNIPVVLTYTGNGETDATIPTQIVIDKIGMSGSSEITFNWEWPFEGNDTTDTGLGLEGTAAITVSAEITFTQID